MTEYVTINGHTYSDGTSDEGTGIRYLDNGGHWTNFLPLLQDTMVEVDGITTTTAADVTAAEAAKVAAELAQAAAETAAVTAVSAPGTMSSSTTSIAIGSGSKTITIETGKLLEPGMTVNAASAAAPSTNFMNGVVTAYNSGTGALTFSVGTSFGGSGSYADWLVHLVGPVGDKGDKGNKGDPGVDGANGLDGTLANSNYKTANFSAVAHYSYNVNTTGINPLTPLTGLLPAFPAQGDTFEFTPFAESWSTSPFLIDRNGHSFQDRFGNVYAEDLDCNINCRMVVTFDTPYWKFL